MDEDAQETRRRVIFDALQAAAADDPDIGEAVLVGFVCIGEWQAPDGKKWLTKVSGNHHEELAPWDERKLTGEHYFRWGSYPNGDDEPTEPEEDDEEEG